MNGARPAPYERLIRDVLGNLIGGHDPRHIEAYMRIEHPTLDNLSREQFRAEARIGLECVCTVGALEAEKCARTFGL